MTLYLIGISAGQLIYGPFSDRYGRRPILMVGLGLFLVSSIAGALATSIDLLIFSRLMQSLGACAGTVIMRAIVRDVYDRQKATSVLGYISMTMVAGPAMAPAIGGYLDHVFSWRAVMVFLAVVSAFIFLFSLRWLKETHFNRTGSLNFISVLRDYRQLCAMPAFLSYAVLVGLSAGMFFTFLGSAEPLLGQKP